MGESESIAEQLASFMKELNQRQQEWETRIESRLSEFTTQIFELGLKPRMQGSVGGDGGAENVTVGGGIATGSVTAEQETWAGLEGSFGAGSEGGGPPRCAGHGRGNWNRGKEVEGLRNPKNGGFKREKQSYEGWGMEQPKGNWVPRYSKMEFPTYDGRDDPLVWLRRCDQFFGSQRTLEEDKVGLAGFHLTGEAQLWFYQLEQEDPNLDWLNFSEQCNVRFGPPMSNNPLGELANLKQCGTVEEYQRQFQTLLARTADLRPRQQVNLFTAGLVEYLRIEVELQQPMTLGIAMNLARTLERKSQYLGHTRAVGGANSYKQGVSGVKPTLPPSGGTRGATTPFFKRLTRAEIADRRTKGLCFNCDEPYTNNHRCKKLFWIEVPEDASDAEEEIDEDVGISLNAISGVRKSRTMQLQAHIGNKSVWVLIDSGSTHNFIAQRVIPKLGVQVQERKGLRVTVANGEMVASAGICRGILFQVGKHSFMADLYSIPLEGFDVVLGIRWLSTLGPILWDFAALTMRFEKGGQQICWQGQAPPIGPTLASLKTEPPDFSAMEELLAEFPDLFEEPAGLPPSRNCDHRITMTPGAGPVVVRPYRYPHLLKDEIERQCELMLKQGIIRPSRSPFSSPVLLVKKADGSWRFCVDYRELNHRTVKDKFPIPVVDELLDELHGSKFFTKLDLTSGYHQIRMDSQDVEKTAFRTHHGHYEFLVMPFGLSNAPSTFQGLMNEVFRSYLRQFVLVFFDDILVYSQSWMEHLQHLRLVFELLRQHQLYVKRSKCSFGARQVTYLGHIIHGAGVEVDPSKIQAIRDWPTPQTKKGLRGFLRLTGYYRKFIHNYGHIAAPLTSLLKKNAFVWNNDADTAFQALKTALSSAPVLNLPNFEEEFVIECDASGSGIGAILQQNGHPVAFFSRKLADRHQKLAAYERELIGLAKAVAHWRPYLWGRQFLIRTDHYSLKYLLDQRLSTSPQQHWISKLLGFDFRVEYRAGKLNKAADALSCRDEEGGHFFAITCTKAQILEDIKHEIQTTDALSQLQEQIMKGEKGPEWSIQDGLILYHKRLYLLASSPLVSTLIASIHDSTHEGVLKTLERVRREFFWTGMKAMVAEYVRACLVCQKNKWEHLHPAGLLQPLPVPQQIWADISMDFIEALPRVHGKSVLLVVVDRFSKYGHFIPLCHPFTATSVARVFFSEIFRLHGLSESIVTDRDKIFTSLFWKELFRLSGSKLTFTSAYHPQSDGQTEVLNRTIEMYLRCFVGDPPRSWVDWIPWAEYCYNTSFHTALHTTPFQLVYGRDPPKLLDYTADSTQVAAVDRALQDRSAILLAAKERLLQAQQRMKSTYDSKHTEVSFNLGDWVWLKLHPYRQLSISRRGSLKLSPKYYGPYQVLSKIGSVAYELELPSHSRIHNVFHVSLLKPFVGTPPATPPDLPLLQDGQVLPVPSTVLRFRLNRGRPELLIQWAHGTPEAATWEDLDTMRTAYPDFKLEDKLDFEDGSNVVDAFIGRVYNRKKQNSSNTRD